MTGASRSSFASLPNNRAAIYAVDADGIPHISIVALGLTGLPR